MPSRSLPVLRRLSLALLLLCLVSLSRSIAYAQDADAPAAEARAPKLLDTDWPSVPKDRLSVEKWSTRHKQILDTIKQAQPRLIFLGDSITQRWEYEGSKPVNAYSKVWQQYYGDRKAFNLGFSGDTTANLLWRIQNGELEGIHPAVAVMLIGTNNNGASKTTPAPRTSAAIELIVKELHKRQPQMKVLLIGILPKETTAEKYSIDRQVNATVEKDLASDALVTFVDVGRLFLKPDGTLDTSLFYDPIASTPHPALHPTAVGMEKIAAAIEPTLSRLLGDKPKTSR